MFLALWWSSATSTEHIYTHNHMQNWQLHTDKTNRSWPLTPVIWIILSIQDQSKVKSWKWVMIAEVWPPWSCSVKQLVNSHLMERSFNCVAAEKHGREGGGEAEWGSQMILWSRKYTELKACGSVCVFPGFPRHWQPNITVTQPASCAHPHPGQISTMKTSANFINSVYTLNYQSINQTCWCTNSAVSWE